MCTAAVYKTKDHYFGRNLDFDISYGEKIAITPRNYPFSFRKVKDLESHYAMIGMATVVGGYEAMKKVQENYFKNRRNV